MTTPPNFAVRRATVEDLAALRALWASMRFAADELEKRLTEFQVILDADGRLAGALGLQIAGPHARLHGEAFVDFALADVMRAALLQRIGSLAANHGVLRLWTQERAPFWAQHGFKPADAELMKKLPAAWAGKGAWLTLQLKDEDAIAAMEKELVLLLEKERRRAARLVRHAHSLKSVATLLAVLFALFVVSVAIWLLHKQPGILPFGR